MPWTLYRYILRELLKVLALTTAVMVVVLSFGAAIGPMSDGLLGPVSLIKFVFYTMPTVLGFALPFAGAFSATVVFHAMSKDNELLACRAGGLSYSRIFAPVVMTGLVLMLVLLLLSNTIVPGFWKSAKKTVEGDVLGILVGQLNQNRPYTFGDGLILYADAAEVREPPAGVSAGDLVPEQFIVMTGVAVAEFDPEAGQLRNDTTASTASALLVRDPQTDRSYISLRLQDPVYYDALSGEFGQFGEVSTDQPILLPDPISDEAVFFTFQDLMRLKRQPHTFDIVRTALGDLAAAVSRQQLTHLIELRLDPAEGGPGFVVLKGGLGSEYYRVSAPRYTVTDRGLALRGDEDQPVTVERFDNAGLLGQPLRRFDAHDAEVVIRTGPFDREPVVSVTLRATPDRFVRVFALNASDPPNEKATHAFATMQYPERVLGVDPSTLTAEQVNDWAMREQIRDAAGVQQARSALRFRMYQLKYMIDAELYTRFATALATPLLLLVGTLLSVRLRDRLPLVVFFWAFVLAIVTLVMIHTGQSMSSRISPDELGQGVDRLIGVGVLWGGNLILLLVVARLYLRIARN